MVKEAPKKKIGCMIVSIGEEYRPLSHCAVRSFKKFHPNVDMHYIDETNIESFEVNKHCPSYIRSHYGIFRFAIAAEIMGKQKYDKFIILGADTITCSRLDEFMDIDDTDILATSCYPYQTRYPYGVGQRIDSDDKEHQGKFCFHAIYVPIVYIAKDHEGKNLKDKNGNDEVFLFHGNLGSFHELSKERLEKDGVRLKIIDYMHANTDVVCFNSLSALKDVFNYSIKHWTDFYPDNMSDSDRKKVYNTPNHSHRPPFVLENPENKTRKDALTDVGYHFYGDQGGLNLVLALSAWQNSDTNPSIVSMCPDISFPRYNFQFVDLPFFASNMTYNARSKRSVSELTVEAESEGKDKTLHPKSIPDDPAVGKSVGDFYVDNNKLFTVDDKQIKVWHYIAGLGNYTISTAIATNKSLTEDERILRKKSFCDKVNNFIFDIFNQETRDFFTNQCDCDDFFQEEFKLE
tara:strand:- start:2096 stop:3478 length:1383 start_codon:yes stop_codon:yes gene_type:complete